MKIELKKSQYFKPEVLDETQTNQELNKNLKEALQRRAGEIFPEVLSEAIRLKKFFEGDAIEISVSITIGNPDEEVEDDENYKI